MKFFNIILNEMKLINIVNMIEKFKWRMSYKED